MLTLKRVALLSLLTASMLPLQGCIATAVVAGAATAGKIATDPRSAGTQVDDEVLEERVAYNISKDAQLREESRINVIAYNGKVLLIGQTPSQVAADTAKGLAEGAEGVAEVFNEIRVGSPITVGQISKDSLITTAIKSKLFVNADVKSTDVKVVTENGEVFLMGKLSSTQADAAAEVASNISGVSKVIKVITYVNNQ